jgi:uncharacterized membrane protein
MIKHNKYKIIVSSLVTILPLFIGLILWNKLPDKIVTSFGWYGEANGYNSKAFAVFGLPLILLLVNLICIIATSADPRRNNISNGMFSLVISIVPICSVICGVCIYGNAMGYVLKVENIMSIFIGVLFIVLGFILPRCKQNYTIGIKLPWTLHDEDNWNKTHKLAGKVWIIGGVVMVFVGLLQSKVLFFSVIAALVLIPTVYSFLLYKNNNQS